MVRIEASQGRVQQDSQQSCKAEARKRRRKDSAHANHVSPIAFWVEQGCWPGQEGLPEDNIIMSETVLAMDRLVARRRSASSATSSNQFSGTRYRMLLEIKGSHMETSKLGITDESKDLVKDLLHAEQPTPRDTIFDDDVFVDACRNLQDRHEPKIAQDIGRLLVPSAEGLGLRDRRLDHLVESVRERWSNSIPLTGSSPQPDYSVGFRRQAFSKDQLEKLSPILGEFWEYDESFFMATHFMSFPFLTCEVTGSETALDTADCQNAHSMTLAVRAIVELFRLVQREEEVNRTILAFSISHGKSDVRIYGHYPVIQAGEATEYYRHPIHGFNITALEGKERWTAYRFTRNVYERWAPGHWRKICSAVDQLPAHQ